MQCVIYRPKIIEGLNGVLFRKLCAGSQYSLALTTSGCVSLFISGFLCVIALYAFVKTVDVRLGIVKLH